MSTQAELSPLARKVYEAVTQDGMCGPCLIDTADAFPVVPGDSAMSEFERDIRDWGVVMGVAYGIARGEDPYESRDSVLARALPAAKEAYANYGDELIFTPAGFLKDRANRQAVAS